MHMVTAWHIHAIRIIGSRWRKYTNEEPVGFPSQKDTNAELWWFLCGYPEQSIEKTVEIPMICHIMTLMCFVQQYYIIRRLSQYDPPRSAMCIQEPILQNVYQLIKQIMWTFFILLLILVIATICHIDYRKHCTCLDSQLSRHVQNCTW